MVVAVSTHPVRALNLSARVSVMPGRPAIIWFLVNWVCFSWLKSSSDGM